MTIDNPVLNTEVIEIPSSKPNVDVAREVTQVINEKGEVSLGELTIIPICISSVADRNNYQPIPYEEDSEGYQRVMDKLNGTYSGANVIPSYW